MSLTMIAGPAEEVVTTAEAKARLKLDGSAEDLLIASLILTSRLQVEAALGLALVSQRWTLSLDAWPEGDTVVLPLRPVLSIDEVRVRKADGTATVVAPGDYLLDGAGLPARLVRSGARWPAPGRAARGIEIDFTAGFGSAAEDVPAPVRHAILLLATHWYEHREPMEPGVSLFGVPPAVSGLLGPYQVPRL